VKIQYLPLGDGPHEAEILNRHYFQTIVFKRYIFLKILCLKIYFVLKDT